MNFYSRRNRRLFLPIIVLGILLSGCSQLLDQLPTQRSFPSLTPQSTWTAWPSISPSPTTQYTSTPYPVAQIGTEIADSNVRIDPQNIHNLTKRFQYGYGTPIFLSLINGDEILIGTSHQLLLMNKNDKSISPLQAWNFPLSSVQINSDGSLAAVGTTFGTVDIVALPSGEILQSIQSGYNLPILAFAFSRDDHQIALSLPNGAVQLWDITSGSKTGQMNVRLRSAVQLSFSPDDTFLFAWAVGESMQQWNLTYNRWEEGYYIGRDELGKNPVDLVFSQDGAYFASNHGKRIRVFKTGNGTTRNLVRDIETGVSILTLSPDGSLLAYIDGSTLKLIDLVEDELLSETELDSQTAVDTAAMAFISNRQLALIGSALSLYDLEQEIEPAWTSTTLFTGETIRQIVVPDDQKIASITNTGVLSMFQFNSGLLENSQQLTDVVSMAVLSPDRSLLSIAAWQGSVTVYQNPDREILTEINGINNTIRSLAVSSGNNLLAVGTDKPSIRIYGLDEGTLITELNCDRSPQKLAFADSEDLLLVQEAGLITLREIEDNSILKSHKGNGLVISEDQSLYAYNSYQNSEYVVNIHALPSGDMINSLPSKGGQLAISADNSIIAAQHGLITFWDIEEGSLLYTISDQVGFGQINFTTDGKFFYLWQRNGIIQAWGIQQ